MLSKIIGQTVVVPLSGTATSVLLTTFTGVAPKVVRIASSSPAFINFNTTATTNTGILVPNGAAEHFKLENSLSVASTGTANSNPSYIKTYAISSPWISVLQAESGGYISITPVA